MTTSKEGYQIPSAFKIIQIIQNEQPNMLLVHKTEFDRIIKFNNKNNGLYKPYKDYLEMLYKTYILVESTNDVKTNLSQHVGMKMLHNMV